MDSIPSPPLFFSPLFLGRFSRFGLGPDLMGQPPYFFRRPLLPAGVLELVDKPFVAQGSPTHCQIPVDLPIRLKKRIPFILHHLMPSRCIEITQFNKIFNFFLERVEPTELRTVHFDHFN